MDEEKGERESGPIFKDIRRYFCDHCGICRSKKSLIISHILNYHPEKVDNGGKEEEEISSLNECQECGATFRKPAYLKQHLRSHSLVRPFVCSVDDCHASYRRKDHLNRHLLQHQGKLFICTVQNCNKEFAFQGNMKRHVKEFHAEDSPSPDAGSQKQYVCQEVGCGKVFKFASKLRKHEDSHVKLDSVETFCSEPSCMKYFTNEQCLRAHVQSCHQYINCQICGAKQLKKNIKRHLQSHESGVASEKIKCDIEDCLHTFSTKSNMRQHVKAVHEELESFACSFSGCGMRFAYKHVRDNHEKSTRHVYVPGDFIESPMSSFDQGQGVGGKEHAPPWKCLLEKELLHQKWIQ